MGLIFETPEKGYKIVQEHARAHINRGETPLYTYSFTPSIFGCTFNARCSICGDIYCKTIIEFEEEEDV